jgi:hypothetical protein
LGDQDASSSAPGAPRKRQRPVRVAAIQGQQLDISRIDEVESTLRSEKRRRDAREGVEVLREDDASVSTEERYAREIDRLLRARKEDDKVIEALKTLVKAGPGAPAAAARPAARVDPEFVEAHRKALRANELLAEVVCQLRADRWLYSDLYNVALLRLGELWREHVKVERCVVCQSADACVTLHVSPAASPHAPGIDHRVCNECAFGYVKEALSAPERSFKCPHCRFVLHNLNVNIAAAASLRLETYTPKWEDVVNRKWVNTPPEVRHKVWSRTLREAGGKVSLKDQEYGRRIVDSDEFRDDVDKIAGAPASIVEGVNDSEELNE